MTVSAAESLPDRSIVSPVDERKAWFSQNIEANLDALFGAAIRLTRARADAEDLVADTVTRAWTAFDSLQDRDRFRPWLFRILNNCFISDCRKKAVRPKELLWSEPGNGGEDDEVSSYLMEQSDEFLDFWANPERHFYTTLLGEQIREAIDGLPEVFRITILLINVDGLGYDEAAAVLGVPTGTVRSRMKRGRTLLQKALWQQAHDAGWSRPTQGNAS
jgi:RNA polymerase sigma-70 factor (ECF subfamily)